jgi:pimeloyl-ACP methyl ester carboxylesterase
MKRTELLLAAFGAALLACGALLIERGRGPMRDVILDGGPACPAAPVRILDPTGDSVHGTAVIFHGLGANRIVMLTTGQQFALAGFRVYLPDSPGHGTDTAPFSFAANEACAAGLLSTLERRGEIAPRETVLVGHSMGAALGVRLADYFPAAGTIAVATAPLVPPRRIPSNLLLIAPQFDMPPVLRMERELAAAAGDARTAPEDFRERRAFQLLPVPWKSHTGALFDPAASTAMVRWALESVGAAGAAPPRPDFRAFYGGWLGLLGLLFLFPAAASAAARVSEFRVPPHASVSAPPRRALILITWSIAVILAGLITTRWIPLRTLHMFSGDHLASFLLIAGLLLGGLALTLWHSGSSPHSEARPFAGALCGVILGIVSIIILGAWLNWHLTGTWLIAARWARLPFLVLSLLPICYAEERAVGDPSALSRAHRFRRAIFYFGLRTITWLVLLVAWWTGAANALIPVVYVAFLGALSLGQRLGADALRRRTGSSVGGAVFSAILGAWFLAAVSPLA